MWGDIPLWTVLPDNNNLHKAKSSAKEVYEQIISDAQQAESLMNETLGIGFPLKFAANMLLAKVYMTLATNPDLGDGSSNYWQLAYDEAIKVKNSGRYSDSILTTASYLLSLVRTLTSQFLSIS